jgi:NADH-quinone oxidoreductase subunit N
MNDLLAVLLPAILFAGSVVVILLDAFFHEPAGKTRTVSLAVLLLALVSCFYLWFFRGSGFGGMVVLDTFGLAASCLFVTAGFITLLLAIGTFVDRPQFHSLVLITLVGMILLVSGTHLIVLFIGLEILSLSIYVLASFAKRDPLSAESGLKYFLLGSFASAFFVYGIAFIYGATGSAQLDGIAAVMKASASGYHRPLLFLGVSFLMVGYAFKISLAPFHMWTPDVYEGAPTPVTAFMAATVKAAALASLIRVLLVAFPELAGYWKPLVWVLAIVTMTVGNLVALWQDNLKRLLAYSSIAHAGYMLLGLLASPEQSQQTVLFYFAAYVVMNLGAFAVVSTMEKTQGILTVPGYQSLGFSRPLIALCMTLFLVSLGGLPPTAGFFGKFYLFRAVLQAGYVWAVVLAVLNSAVSFYYYLRVVIVMYTPEKEGSRLPQVAISVPFVIVLVVTVWGTIFLGLFPNLFLQLARAVSIAG